MSENTKSIITGENYWTFFGERITELMDYKQGSKVLDIGTGTGSALFPAAEVIGPKGKAIGIDLWDNRISETLRIANERKLDNVFAERMDARDISYSDNSFDYVVSNFIGFGGFYDFKNQKLTSDNHVLKHIYRILKPGGKVGISTWEKQEELDFLRDLIIEYLMENVQNTADTEVPISYSKENTIGIHRLLSDGGFSDISIQVESFSIRYPTIDDWYNYMLKVGWILKRIIGSDSTKLVNFKKKFLPHRLKPFKRHDGYYFTKSVIFAFATK